MQLSPAPGGKLGVGGLRSISDGHGPCKSVPPLCLRFGLTALEFRRLTVRRQFTARAGRPSRFAGGRRTVGRALHCKHSAGASRSECCTLRALLPSEQQCKPNTGRSCLALRVAKQVPSGTSALTSPSSGRAYGPPLMSNVRRLQLRSVHARTARITKRRVAAKATHRCGPGGAIGCRPTHYSRRSGVCSSCRVPCR